MPAGFVATARLGTIHTSSDWLRAEDDFIETFSAEVGEELQRCMVGVTPIDVRIHLDHFQRGGRLETFLNGRGEHRLAGDVEFVDREQGGVVVGRFPIAVVVQDPGGLAGLIADRQMVASEAFGRAICEEGFGRNPREPGPANATAE